MARGRIGFPRSARWTSGAAIPHKPKHPVIRTHPKPGRKGLFVNSTFTIRFSGMSEEESASLLGSA
jgi:alpha-ketoglutarate-dependent taurine dioxygenase